jgi:hypothetical protein
MIISGSLKNGNSVYRKGSKYPYHVTVNVLTERVVKVLDIYRWRPTKSSKPPVKRVAWRLGEYAGRNEDER